MLPMATPIPAPIAVPIAIPAPTVFNLTVSFRSSADPFQRMRVKNHSGLSKTGRNRPVAVIHAADCLCFELLRALYYHAHFHSLEGVSFSDKTARHWYCLQYVTRYSDGHKISAADATIRWVKSNPACSRDVHLGPRVG